MWRMRHFLLSLETFISCLRTTSSVIFFLLFFPLLRSNSSDENFSFTDYRIGIHKFSFFPRWETNHLPCQIFLFDLWAVENNRGRQWSTGKLVKREKKIFIRSIENDNRHEHLSISISWVIFSGKNRRSSVRDWISADFSVISDSWIRFPLKKDYSVRRRIVCWHCTRVLWCDLHKQRRSLRILIRNSAVEHWV